MTDDKLKTIESIRDRYLNEYKNIHKEADLIAFFEDISNTADKEKNGGQVFTLDS